jgi:hypothetical protein
MNSLRGRGGPARESHDHPPHHRDRGDEQHGEESHRAPLGPDPGGGLEAGGAQGELAHLVAEQQHRHEGEEHRAGQEPGGPGGVAGPEGEGGRPRGGDREQDAGGEERHRPDVAPDEANEDRLRLRDEQPRAHEDVHGGHERERHRPRPHRPRPELRLPRATERAVHGDGEGGHRHRTEEDMGVAGPQSGVVEVEGEPASAPSVDVDEGSGAEGASDVRHVQKGDDGEEEGHADGDRAVRGSGSVGPKGEAVRPEVGGDDERNHGQPQPAHQDRAREEDPPVEDLHEEQGGDPEGHRGRHRHREGLREQGHDRRPVRGVGRSAPQTPVEGEDGAPEDDVHGENVEEERELQEGPQKDGRRRLREGIGERDQGAHGFPSSPGAPSPAT